MPKAPLVFIIAGEPSGDRIGAGIMEALQHSSLGQVRFAGIGGRFMEETSLDSLFPMSDLSLMGAVEIIPKLPNLIKRYSQTIQALKTLKPDVLVTIDSPEFCLRVAQKAKTLGIPTIHYTAPTVWAWRPGRAAAMATYLDHLLLLYGFEKPYFEAVNLPNTFVGHPLCSKGIEDQSPEDFRAKYKVGAQTPLVCIVPGSRLSEVHRLLPLFHEALKKLTQKHPKLKLVLPVAPSVESVVRDKVAQWDLPVTLVYGEADKYGAMNASTVALAASGTITLELGMAKLPTLITYRMNPVTVFLGRFFIKTQYIGLPNIILNKPAVPELLQQACTPENIVHHLDQLITDPTVRTAQLKSFDQLRNHLLIPGSSPSQKAADVIETFLQKQV